MSDITYRSSNKNNRLRYIPDREDEIILGKNNVNSNRTWNGLGSVKDLSYIIDLIFINSETITIIPLI